ncbi:hypothetical protein TWF225_003679 [Orbilia oligospora]|nr:hypothetical protein TWF225_003679 [Orbilia oligospora]KAF3195272.1 hypothetical protein TWF225_003679 [Orbilia oligospora]KAF3267585.1 hypothetical protein TWF128_009115 [Orbilia oligospora]KAF3267586.1 hypothetical protein TWF128_009115 [Orbilia oligospora]KAF3269204.1 hypothetical protein TWF217_009298 [Orbilia oligospora]
MVASIPPPTLSSLLPAFLAQLPASFASPKPPPSLPPLLTPLTRSRLTHLSFNLTTENSWLSLLTWSSTPSDGQTLQEHLASQDYYFLHQPPSPNTFVNKGYRRLDSETLQCLVSVPELEVVVLYQFVADDLISEEGEIGNAWKVHDVRLADDEEEAFLRAGGFWSSIDAAEEEFRTVPKYGGYSYGNNDSNNNLYQPQKQEAVDDEDSDDDYWGRYDDEETESVAGDEEPRPAVTNHHHHQQLQQQQPQSHVQIAASLLARRVLQGQTEERQQEEEEDKEEEEYYARYANVEPVLDNPTPTTVPQTTGTEGIDRRDSISTNLTSASTTFDAQTMSTPLTAFTHPSTKVSPVIQATTLANHPTVTSSHSHSNPKPEIATAKRVVAGLESAAEVHTQNEVAIQQHVSTSVKSLYRLWKAGGMDCEEFGRFLEREVEVLKVVEEAGELGS